MRRVGVTLCAGLGFAMLFWVIGPSVCRSQEPLAAASNSIELDRPLHFVSTDGSDLLLQAGRYSVEVDRGRHLRLRQDTGSIEVLLDSRPASHESAVQTPTALLIPQGDDLRHLVLVLPDGTSLETVGSLSGIRERGAVMAVSPSMINGAIADRRLPGPVSIGSVQSPGRVPATPAGPAGNTLNLAPLKDVMPKPTMSGIFRREEPGHTVMLDGSPYYRINKQYCQGLSADQSRLVPLPDLVWGASNVGTVAILTPFSIQLRMRRPDPIPPSHGWPSSPDYEMSVPTLLPKHDVSVTTARPIEVRVTYLSTNFYNGCYISPAAPPYYEDPELQVHVNINDEHMENNRHTY